jgi:CRISPR-associated protein Cas2
MYIVLVYDMEEKRVVKMLKLCRRYLNWIQNSVFEGELSDVKLKELLYEAGEIMELDKDSIIVFKSRQEKWMEKQILGKEKNALDNII